MIDEHDDDNNSIPVSTTIDSFSIINRGGQTLTQQNLDGLLCVDVNKLSYVLDGGYHCDNTTTADRRSTQRRLFQRYNYNYREYLFQTIEILGLENRLNPMGSTTTNNH